MSKAHNLNDARITPQQKQSVEHGEDYDPSHIANVSDEKYAAFSELARRIDEWETKHPGQTILALQRYLNLLYEFRAIRPIIRALEELEDIAPNESILALQNYLDLIAKNDMYRRVIEGLASKGEAPSQQALAYLANLDRQAIHQQHSKGLDEQAQQDKLMPIRGKDGKPISIAPIIDECRLAFKSTTETKSLQAYDALKFIQSAKYRLEFWKVIDGVAQPNNWHYIENWQEDDTFFIFRSLEEDLPDEKGNYPKLRRGKHRSCRIYDLKTKDQVAGYPMVRTKQLDGSFKWVAPEKKSRKKRKA